ncbi:MAG: large-conductance mechanosensitive channel protein MscL [Clostridia bacterium]|nr:large-conductance mechanosensitive channel protein MscL [Clostridia bacterium]NCC75639.1 large-conductance mechanosensitive channel protein MscL [Clostridia bacterium]
MVGEFKKFMLRGNVIDLAVGLVMGSAFGAIVTSLVNDIIMPIIGYATAGISFVDLKIILAAAVLENGEIIKPEVAIGYGKLIQVILNFILIGFSIFFIVKGINKMRARMEKPPEPAAPPAKPDDVVLLEEIRDLLKK